QFLQSVDHDERGKAAADALVQEVRTLSEMITSFLNFARPQPLQLEDVSLDELIRECARELLPLFEARRVQCVSNPIVREGVVGKWDGSSSMGQHAAADRGRSPRWREVG